MKTVLFVVVLLVTIGVGSALLYKIGEVIVEMQDTSRHGEHGRWRRDHEETEADEDTGHTIELLRALQNPLQDYADMVGAPAFAYGIRYVYPEPEDYAIETAIMALEEMSRNRWIPVTERLPEDDAFVLVTVKGKYRDIIFEDAVEIASYYDGDGWELEAYPELVNPNVTAWQPLPAPYISDQEQDKPSSGWQEQMASTFLGDSRL